MEAIDVLKYLLTKAESEAPEGHRIVELNVPVDIVREIIDAQLERKTGVWLDDEDDPESIKTDGYCGYCSACKEWSEYLTAYCGSCGADMRGTWNETN